MISNFSIYKKGGVVTDVPAAAKEHLIIMNFHNQDNALSVGGSLGIVAAYMSNELSYSSQGNYKNVWDIRWTGDSTPAKLISDETQRNIFNHGYATKKLFSNGDSPSINLSFVVYAGDDNQSSYIDSGNGMTLLSNDPVSTAQLLVAATLPKVVANNIGNATNVETFIKSMGGSGWDASTTVGTGMIQAGATFTTNAATGELGKAVTESYTIAKNTISNVSDILTSRKPPVCKLTIGNIFEKDFMVVRKVDVTFSKEYVGEGKPLYAKFEVIMESLFNASNIIGEDKDNQNLIFGSGLKITKDTKSRVSLASKEEIAAMSTQNPAAPIPPVNNSGQTTQTSNGAPVSNPSFNPMKTYKRVQ